MTNNFSAPRHRRTLENRFVNMVVGTLNSKRYVALGVIFALLVGFALPNPFSQRTSLLPQGFSPITPVKANSTYYDFTSGNLTLTISAATANMITTNDNWSGVNSVEGYEGRDLTVTHGVDPQTVLGTEFANDQLPNTPTQVNANKGNPSAYNAGGVTEFDQGPEYAIGFQGNVHANPYMVFYLNTTGHSNVTVSYTATDLDGGANDSVSPVALQYRVGETGPFTNLPAGYIADVTVGGATAPPITKSVLLPPDAGNKPKVQVRLVTTNAANAAGSSTPDEWIGINNVVISVLAPTAAGVTVGGQVRSADGAPISRVTMTLSDFQGNMRSATTNQFGYYFFENVAIDETYVVAVNSRRYVFPQPSQMVFVSEATKSLDFQAAPSFYDFKPRSKSFKLLP